MKNLLFFAVALLLFISTCGKPTQKEPEPLPGTVIVREKYRSGGIKSESTVINDKKQGISKNYDLQGRLISEVNYVDDIKEGMATNYYAASGKIYSTMIYKNDIKEGDEIWYFESGKPYRVSPYVQGKIDGIQKYYYESGEIKAEVPYKNGSPGIGTKEYNKDGSLVTDYPEIKIIKQDHLQAANKILLLISLSSVDSEVKFYRGDLLDNQYLHDEMLQLATQNATTQIDFTVSPGSKISQNVIISANHKTRMGNHRVISITYHLQAQH
jgi:antitoxin component YwqK of YwqJK toxin-antitoxin module